jgi:hypothetical protein
MFEEMTQDANELDEDEVVQQTIEYVKSKSEKNNLLSLHTHLSDELKSNS